MRMTIIGAMASMVAACASIGRPEGGPRDEEPPVFVKSNPSPGSTNVDRSKISIYFNENIKLDDPSNKIVVSPAQTQNPKVSSNGKHISLELMDSMKPNTTYTIDFADAVRDLNEGNILDGFVMDFATGNSIDTLRVSGMVFEARNLEPAQGMVVGIYSNLSDSAISTLPLERVTKTNQYGQFTIRNLKPGTYNLFAIDDKNHDWHWDRSENIAFATATFSPSVESVLVADTLRSSTGTDSIVSRTAWHYMPDDILLTWFNENYRPQYLREYERTDRRRITFKFGTECDSMPQVTILNGERKGKHLSDVSVFETRVERDSFVYWLRDSVLLKQDSLLVEAKYRKTDTLEQIVWVNDTLKLHVTNAIRKEEKEEERVKAENLKSAREDIKKRFKEQEKAHDKALEECRKQNERRQKDGLPPLTEQESDSIALLAGYDANNLISLEDTIKIQPEIPILDFKPVSSNSQDLHLPMVFEAGAPVERIDSLAWRLEEQVDTVWHRVSGVSFVQDSLNIRRYNLNVKWKEGMKYRFVADSCAVTDIYGVGTKNISHEFSAKTAEDYGKITLIITDYSQLSDSSMQVIVELLGKDDKVVKSAIAGDDGSVTFTYITPGTYYARAFIDANKNGKWDTGNYAEKRQPEDVFYYNKSLVLRKNWDIDQEWAMLGEPVDLQKPDAIKKNKPKTRDNNSRDRNYRDRDGDEYGEDGYYEDESGFGANYFEDNSWGNGSQYNNANRGNNGRRKNGNLRRNNRY